MPNLQKYLFTACLVLCGFGCEPIADMDYSAESSAPLFRATTLTDAPPKAANPEVRVMAWNIKYGAGRIPFWFDCWGDRSQLTEDELVRNMGGIYDLINEAKPDILMVEEIELHSRRSQYFNMIQGILDATDLNYAAYFETWDSRYVPSEGLGRMNLGNAIFSRYPITNTRRIAQMDRTDLDALTETFYIRRAIGRVEIDLGSQPIAAYVVHTEAYDEDGTKGRQIQQIYDVVSEETGPFILGGDFNELPPTAIRLEDFPDERSEALCSDEFNQPPYTPDLMTPFFNDFTPSITLDQYGDDEASQSRYFTHSVLGPDELNESGVPGEWNRTLDYLFANANSVWVDGSTDILQRKDQTVGNLSWQLSADPLRLSDHAPVFGILEVRP